MARNRSIFVSVSLPSGVFMATAAIVQRSHTSVHWSLLK